MSLGPLYVFLGEVSVQVLCPFFNWVACLLRVESCEFFIYFGDQALVWGIIGKYVFPYGWFSFHFNAVFFNHAEAFYFDEIPFVYSFLYVPKAIEFKRSQYKSCLKNLKVREGCMCWLEKAFNYDVTIPFYNLGGSNFLLQTTCSEPTLPPLPLPVIAAPETSPGGNLPRSVSVSGGPSLDVIMAGHKADHSQQNSHHSQGRPLPRLEASPSILGQYGHKHLPPFKIPTNFSPASHS